MSRAKKSLIIALVVGVSIFGYSQYASASQIDVTITQSKLLEKNEQNSTYNIRLLFENPSLLLLTAGESDFHIIAEDQTIGEGKLEPFILPPVGSSLVSGTFQTDPKWEYDESSAVKISGLTKYDVFFMSIEIPFTFYPDGKQIREFID